MLGSAIICLIVSSIFLPFIKADLGLDLRVRNSSEILYSSVHLRSRAYDGATNVGGIEVLGVGFFDLPADIYLEDGEYTVVGSGGIFDGNKYAFDKWEGPVANPSQPATTLFASGEVTLTLVLFKWDFDLDVSPSSNTVRQGDGALYEVTVTATGGWTTETGENVRVQVEILNTPLGITKNFAGSFMLSQSNPIDTHACTIYTSETDTPTGTYSITFEGTIESTTTTHSKTVDLVVELKEGPPPDLIIEDFWWSPGNPQPGDEVTFTYIEKNQGKGDASAHRNTLLIDDIPISNDVVEALAAGAPRTRTFPDKWIATSGAHDALVKADDQNGVTESDEENNFHEETIGEKEQVSTSLTIDLDSSGILPNTIIGITISGRLTRIGTGTGIADRPIRLDWTGGLTTVTTNADGYYSYFTDVGPYEEGTYEFTASFERYETPSAIFLPSTGSTTLSVGKIATYITIFLTPSTVEPNTETDVIINGQLITVDGDAGLGQKTIELTYGWGGSSSTTTDENGYYSKSVSVSLSPGSYLITVSFEGDSIYVESTTSDTLQVTEGNTDLTITNVTWSPSDPMVGDSVTFSYIVENQGTKGTTDFTNALYIDGERIDISVRTSLVAGETQTGSFTYTWTATEGPHEIKIVADDLGEITESNEDNNQMVASLTIETQNNVSVEITSYQIASGTFFPGDTVTAVATIQNTGDVEWTFYIGYSVQDSNGEWWDTPYKTITLDPGDSETIALFWTVPILPPIPVPTGSYLARVAVWKGESDGKLQSRLDVKEKQNAFHVYVPMMEIGYRITVNVWPSWAVKGSVIAYLYDADGDLINDQVQGAGWVGSGPYQFEFMVWGSPPVGTYKVGTILKYEVPVPGGLDTLEVPASTSITFWLEGDVVIDLYPSIPDMNTVIALKESQHKLLLHVYDSQGRHVGIDYDSERLEADIPDAYYIDYLNGTILVILPSSIAEFSYVVDAKYAMYEKENYDVTITVVKQGEMISTSIHSGTIKQDERQEKNVQVLSEIGKVNFMPEIIEIDMPNTVAVGSELLVKVNATDHEGIENVFLKILDPNGDWHNYTAELMEGFYMFDIDTHKFKAGTHKAYLEVKDIDGAKVKSPMYTLMMSQPPVFELKWLLVAILAAVGVLTIIAFSIRSKKVVK